MTSEVSTIDFKSLRLLIEELLGESSSYLMFMHHKQIVRGQRGAGESRLRPLYAG